jgi:hypothetical protein
MRMINRAALVVMPKEPCLRWIASLDDEAPGQDVSLPHSVSIYLVPEDPKEEEETAPIEDFFEEIFENELAGWSSDEDDWPSVRDLKTFLDWFDVRGESVVIDLGKGRIAFEPY